jgi:lysophospholipase L1-like esterase
MRGYSKAELRRLMIERVATLPGKFATRDFIVQHSPAGHSRRRAGIVQGSRKVLRGVGLGRQATIEFSDSQPKLAALTVEPVRVPTLYIAGDSTSTDQAREPFNSWGQMLPRFFKPTVAIANHGESGESLHSFIAEHRLAKIMSVIKPGDYLFMQCGHNDQKERDEGVGAFTTYKADLKRLVAEAWQHGATPVLITPMNRRTFDAAGKIDNSLGDFPAAVRQVAKEEKAALIDLHAISKVLYEALDPVGSGEAVRGRRSHPP